MIIEICTDQAECLLVLDSLKLNDLKPIPPNRSCSAFLELSGDSFLVLENDNGKYTFHLLHQTTKDVAWSYFDTLNMNRKPCNFRLAYLDSAQAAQSAPSN